jgi:hypothetical protein
VVEIRHGALFSLTRFNLSLEFENGVHRARGGFKLPGARFEQTDQGIARSKRHVVKAATGTAGNMVADLAEGALFRGLDILVAAWAIGFSGGRTSHIYIRVSERMRQASGRAVAATFIPYMACHSTFF